MDPEKFIMRSGVANGDSKVEQQVIVTDSATFAFAR